MIEVLFKRVSRSLSWPVPGGVRTVEAFSEVRNELNGQRPDPSRLPDVETGCNQDRSPGPVVMPRPFPPGTWNIIGVEQTDNEWMKPLKVITDAHQSIPIWSMKADGTYGDPTGETFDDWCYWVHFANGSQHTDGCCGQTGLQNQFDFVQMIQNAVSSGILITITCTED